MHSLRADPTSDRAVEEVRRALASKNNHLVAEAAQMVGEFELGQFEADLVRAFERFMADPSKTDKGCQAKTAVAEALYRLGCDQEDVFLRGIRHIQLESAYGGKEDTAARLRSVCALGLVRMHYPQVMIELAHLLADEEPDARIAAARAIAYAQQDAGVPLLRFKVLGGDGSPQVMYGCFSALLKLSPESSLPFVADFLQCDDVAVGEAAAMALGESRMGDAFDSLAAAQEAALDPGFRRTLLVAIAMLRHERAVEFLLSIVADGAPANASDALDALRMYQRDEKVWSRVQHLIDERGDVVVDSH